MDERIINERKKIVKMSGGRKANKCRKRKKKRNKVKMIIGYKYDKERGHKK